MSHIRTISGLVGRNYKWWRPDPFLGWGGANVTAHTLVGHTPYTDFDVIEVTNLNGDTSPGSFRWALGQLGTNPTAIVFTKGGLIDFNGAFVYIRDKSNFSILGQTAPWPGITIINGGLAFQGYNSYSRNFVIQNIKIRMGYEANSSTGDSLAIYNEAYDIVIDSCSMCWGIDENSDVWSLPGFTDPSRRVRNVTLSNCIVAEGLNYANHSKGFLVGDFSYNIYIANNLFISNARRNPGIKNGTKSITVNNYIYNPGTAVIHYFENPNAPVEEARLTVIKNYLQKGGDSGGAAMIQTTQAGSQFYNLKIYHSGNEGYNQNGTPVTIFDGVSSIVVSSPSNAIYHADIENAVNSDQVLPHILNKVGAFSWYRDSVDARYIREVLSGGVDGSIPNYQSYPSYSTRTKTFNASEWDWSGVQVTKKTPFFINT